MKKKFDEWFSVQIAKRPGLIVLLAILVLNIFFVLLSALLISSVGTGDNSIGFSESIYRTITIMLDAGCVDNIVENFKTANFWLVIICLLVVILGMITFTGAIIGYISNYISSFIVNAQNGNRRLKLHDHTIILNWNSRASEIVNDLLYSDSKETVVVLVNEQKDRIENEIIERIANTMNFERRSLLEESKRLGMSKVKAHTFLRKNMFQNRLNVIVREGETFSTTHLFDISVDKAKAIIILSNDMNSSSCKYEVAENLDKYNRGNSNIIKNLVQVAEITGQESSADDQRIIVEVDDDWTLGLVQKIIEYKQREGKCNIYPIAVNKILGQILSQFSIMPELNMVYRDLFSNKGAAFFSKKLECKTNENTFVSEYLASHQHAIPMTTMDIDKKSVGIYISDKEHNIDSSYPPDLPQYSVNFNKNYWIEKKSIIILGHNSESSAIMDGFNAFRSEWNPKVGSEIMNLIVIDDKKNLEKNNYYKDYLYVTDAVEAEIYDKEKICDTINKFIDSNKNDTSILILSDDKVATNDIDACVLTYLLYVHDIISERIKNDSNFNPQSVDVVVEIINPKNYDVIKSYSVNNIVISNRYISKMITQISEKEELFNFYNDILTYDEEEADEYKSKELYIKPVQQFFNEIPKPCTAAQLIRATYVATPNKNKAIVIGMISHDGVMTIWGDNQTKAKVSLTRDDKLIIFSNH